MNDQKEQDVTKAELTQEEAGAEEIIETADAEAEEEQQETTASEATEAELEAAESEATEPEETEPKKGLFKKKKDKKDAQIEELTDKLKRQMAEFDNYRKRTEKEKSAMYEIGVKSIVEKLLPVVDNFERGLSGAEEQEDPFVEGMEMIYKQIVAMLEEIEVKPIEAVGKVFDPEFHNAVMHVEDDEHGESEIIEEFQKGYTYRETVVRHSMVKVAN